MGCNPIFMQIIIIDTNVLLSFNELRNQDNMSNYKSMCMICNFSKILEEIIKLTLIRLQKKLYQ